MLPAQDNKRSAFAPGLALFFFISVANAQVSIGESPVELVVEGYANVTTGFAADETANTTVDDGHTRLDAALRALLRWSNDHGPDVGLRAVVEYSPELELEFAEASVLVFGGHGRLEIGDRQGLPDVLLGYAPNNFTFTGAEFGPASGPSLDPGGGLQAAFLGSAVSAQLRELAGLGFAATLSDDRSTKALYVAPKARGWLAGVSYSPEADDSRFGELAQAGLTHDTYWGENVLHVGGSYSFARANVRATGLRDLHSVNVGATYVWDYDWMLGASITYDGSSATLAPGANESSISDAWGTVISLNYNAGPWTAGAYLQRATREGDSEFRGNDTLTAAEAGLSYRLSTRIRLYGAWYYFRLEDEGDSGLRSEHGNLVLLGVRATL